MPNPAKVTRRQVGSLAWPIVLANLGVPLLGLVDTAVIGHTGTVQDLGAIALGSLIFSFVFWGFGFLRMGTTGFVAQASGQGDSAEVRATVARGMLLALALGVMVLLLQEPIGWLAFRLLGATSDVEHLARGYYDIRIWAAPASLGLFAVLGALIGLGRTKDVLVVQVVLNGLNIGLDLLFAGALKMGVVGVALGTVLAAWSAVLAAALLLFRVLRSERADSEPWWPAARLRNWLRARAMLGANFDIMIRTLFLLLGFGWFTNQGALLGDRVLAANEVLLQLIALSAYLLDGYAHSTEILVGRSVGSGSRAAFDDSVRKSSQLAGMSAIILASAVLLLGNAATMVLTDIAAVRDLAAQFMPFVAVYVALSFGAFQLDGIFIGATATRQMRNASIFSTLVFIAISMLLTPRLGNAGLWLSFVAFVVIRAMALGVAYGGVRGAVGPES